MAIVLFKMFSGRFHSYFFVGLQIRKYITLYYRCSLNINYCLELHHILPFSRYKIDCNHRHILFNIYVLVAQYPVRYPTCLINIFSLYLSLKMGLRVFSHNTQGFNSPHKCKKAFRHYKRLGADIILIQETHFSTANHPLYFDKTYNQHYFTTYANKSRGVAIFIRNSIIFDIQHIYMLIAVILS